MQQITARAKTIGKGDRIDHELIELTYLVRKSFSDRQDLTIGQIAPGNNPLHVAAIVALARKIVLFDLASSSKQEGPYYTLLDNAGQYYPRLTDELRAKIEDRIGYFERTPVYHDLDLVFMQDFNRADWVQKALQDVRTKRGAVMLVESDAGLPRKYGAMIADLRLAAEYSVFSQKGSIFCPVSATNIIEVYEFFHELNGTYAGRTRSCLVLRNPAF